MKINKKENKKTYNLSFSISNQKFPKSEYILNIIFKYLSENYIAKCKFSEQIRFGRILCSNNTSLCCGRTCMFFDKQEECPMFEKKGGE